ncbi:MAG: methyltransferase domain-containing protein [Roseiarcus sp.]
MSSGREEGAPVRGLLADTYRSWAEAFGRQLRCPTGRAGEFIGWLMGIANARPYEVAIDALDPRPGEWVLELGFGPGHGLKALAARLGDGRVFGLDQSAPMVEQAVRRNRAAIAAGRMRLAQGPFSRSPWPDGAFDAILLVNVVYFFDYRGRDIREVYRVLRDGGRIAVYATDRSTMEKWPFARPDTHRTFDRAELLHFLESAGFDKADIEIEAHKLPFGVTGLLALVHKRSTR